MKRSLTKAAGDVRLRDVINAVQNGDISQDKLDNWEAMEVE